MAPFDRFAFGPFMLVPSERRLLRDGVPVPLTPKAFDLLVALVEARGRAISKDELFARIDDQAQRLAGALAEEQSRPAVHIESLRRIMVIAS